MHERNNRELLDPVMFDRRAHFIIPCRTHSPAIYDLPTIEERQKTHVAPKAVFAGCEHPRRPLPRKGTLTPRLGTLSLSVSTLDFAGARKPQH